MTAAPPWLEILDDTIRACATLRRGDLVDRLLDRRALLLEPGRRLVVTGYPGQGKSQLVNALIGTDVCAVGDDLTTVVPTVLRHADRPTAALITGDTTEAPAVESVATHANKLALVRGDVVRAEVGLPRSLLGAGLVLVDSPGFGAPGCPRTARAMAALAEADAVLLVTDATSELSSLELELLTQVGKLCPTVLVALTKIDLVPGWRRVAEADRHRLAQAGVAAPLVPVSSTLRAAAVRAEDRALNQESGFVELIGCLRRDVLTDPVLVAAKAAAATSGLAVDQLIAPLREEFDAGPRAADTRAVAEWHAAGRRVERLQRESARWQTTLSDEVADLMADLDHDLRERTRRILREVDDYFEAADPAKVWPEFSDWMHDNLTAVAETNSQWLLDRFEWIAGRVARQVVPDARQLPAEVLRGLATEHVVGLRKPAIEPFSPVQKAFVGLRGSYSGLLMSGLATTLAGLPLINPISLGAGAAFGARSVFEERGARLKRRQAMAKTTAQRHVDDFFLSYGKESKDATRLIHRALRDRFAEVAQELRDAAAESARLIKRDLDAEAARRTTRAAEVRRELERLLALRARIEAVRGRGA
ncbi:dynamin family protein [Actinokineospora sp. NBRC 105648]|uniref:dynamin family protein n=1 Tax=Actinokineospora sp. NBRC 105648 TaxID=3032206 RepID=UPI0024A36F91|nr:dynamin family protein [Actinokineospora sp. NBRC 105648]GLZ36413.1 isoniazid inducible gene protein IniA [Actinokineospora sp. NBRC 105648]